MELTVEQAREYLASIGIVLPDFLLELLVGQANSIIACMEGAGYPPETQVLIQLYLVSLLAVAQGDRYVTSQRAPSGAAQSFRYRSMAEAWASYYSLLLKLDTSGCATALIPPQPGAPQGFFTVIPGGC